MNNKKILIVEDDMIIQMFLSRILADAGYTIVGEARDSASAIEMADQSAPDLILMDIAIDGLTDGIETALIIKQKRDVSVVFITGNSDKPTIERANKANPSGFIFKPIDENRLKLKLQEIISKA